MPKITLCYYINIKAGVAKWLRQWVVVPLFAGSIPVTRHSCISICSLQVLLC